MLLFKVSIRESTMRTTPLDYTTWAFAGPQIYYGPPLPGPPSQQQMPTAFLPIQRPSTPQQSMLDQRYSYISVPSAGPYIGISKTCLESDSQPLIISTDCPTCLCLHLRPVRNLICKSISCDSAHAS